MDETSQGKSQPASQDEEPAPREGNKVGKEAQYQEQEARGTEPESAPDVLTSQRRQGIRNAEPSLDLVHSSYPLARER
jgi:hypothetical protein